MLDRAFHMSVMAPSFVIKNGESLYHKGMYGKPTRDVYDICTLGRSGSVWLQCLLRVTAEHIFATDAYLTPGISPSYFLCKVPISDLRWTYQLQGKDLFGFRLEYTNMVEATTLYFERIRETKRTNNRISSSRDSRFTLTN